MDGTRGLGVLLVVCAVACTGDGPITPTDVALDAALDAAGRDAHAAPDAPTIDAGPCAIADQDHDGHASIACGGDDCDDADAHRFPGNAEVCDPAGHDEDCDPRTVGATDADHDGAISAACCNTDTAGTRHCGDDCDDTRADARPGLPETCDGIDNDCDSAVDEGLRAQDWYPDCDGDRFGATGIGPVHDCAPPPMPPSMCTPAPAVTSWVAGNDTDCNDGNPHVNPAEIEVCNGIDDDCNGVVDDGLGAASRYYHDADMDGYGVDGTSMLACMAPSGYATFGGDCDDANALVNPGTIELCNAVDDDCDRVVDEGAGATCGLPNATAICAAGACAIGSCAGTFADCDAMIADGCEVDLDTSVTHCGTCGASCPSAAHGSPTCAAATCLVRCDPGYADCDPTAAGCETDTRSNTLNCGACFVGCPRAPNAVETCTAGACGIRCNAGFADCDGMRANGCELSTLTDPANCGACGHACLPSESCFRGACIAPFPSTGADGDCVWTTSTVIAARIWNCRTIRIASGATITTDGSANLELRSIGDVIIDGSVDVSGGVGGTPPASSHYGGGGGTTANPLGVGGASDTMCNGSGVGGDPLSAPGRAPTVALCPAMWGGVFGGGAGGGYVRMGFTTYTGGGGAGGGGWAGGGGGRGASGPGGAGGGIPGRTNGGSSDGGGEPTAGVYAGQNGCGGPGGGLGAFSGGGGSIGAEAVADLPVATTFQCGSGGGGGGLVTTGTAVWSGGGGGGGGGALRIASTTQIVIGLSASLRADGGNGGGSGGGTGTMQYGGGGSGGVIYLSAPVLTNRGVISALGGQGVGMMCVGGIPTVSAGGLGRIRLSVVTAPSSCTLVGITSPPTVSGCTVTPGPGTAGRVYIGEYPN